MPLFRSLAISLAAMLVLAMVPAGSWAATQTYSISASTRPSSGGTISPKGSVKVLPGGDCSFQIEPKPGYYLSDVLVDGTSVGVPSSYSFAGVNAKHSIKAVFQKITYTIAVSAGPNGTIAPNGNLSVYYGTTKSFTAKPAKNYKAAIVVDGAIAVQGSTPSKSVKYKLSQITASHTVRAVFFTGAYPTLDEGSTFRTGQEVVLGRQAIGPDGGSVSIGGSGTNLDGVQVTIPAGALSGSTEISVGYDDGELSLPPGTNAGARPQTLTLGTNGSTQFSQPVEISIPFSDPDHIPVPFYVGEDGTLKEVFVTKIDLENRRLTFVTGHASLWTWVVDVLTDSPDVDSGFRPTDDGFRIANLGSTINTGGECFGMTTFAQWYYDKKMASNGEFYGKYTATVGRDSAGNPVTGQDVIATRAFSTANQAWNWSEFISPNVNTSDEYRYNAIVAALKITRRPVNLSIKVVDENGNFGAGHAVLAFGVDEDDGQLFIYDPNYPGETRQILYDTTTKEFQPYEGYSKFFLNGTGTYSLGESYENIFQDAEHSFTSDNQPHIFVTSHVNGQTVDVRNITLTGTIESSEVLVTQLDVFIGNDRFSTDVAEDGSFSVGLSLTVGVNNLRFVTKGRTADNRLIEIHPNNMDANPFSLNLSGSNSVVLVTLTWDKNDTDLDLYVVDPLGDYSAYYHMFTADGGELDYDVTSGYGPEHWTLSSSDVVRWGQAAYRVRVHYYSDHGNGGTNYKLSVKLYEGTNREVEYTKTGYLSANVPSNDGPLDAGPDWAEFTFPITLTGNGPALARVGSGEPVSSPSELNAVVPPEEERRALKER